MLTTTLLGACGGGSDSSSPKAASLNDIVGVWDISGKDSNGKQDINYFFIDKNSTMIFYDYANDEAEPEEFKRNCYHKGLDLKLTDKGKGKFILQGQENEKAPVEISVNGNSLTMVATNKDGSEQRATAYKSNKTVNDFKPLCK